MINDKDFSPVALEMGTEVALSIFDIISKGTCCKEVLHDATSKLQEHKEVHYVLPNFWFNGKVNDEERYGQFFEYGIKQFEAIKTKGTFYSQKLVGSLLEPYIPTKYSFEEPSKCIVLPSRLSVKKSADSSSVNDFLRFERTCSPNLLSFFNPWAFDKFAYADSGDDKCFVLWPHCQAKVNQRNVNSQKIQNTKDDPGLLDLFSRGWVQGDGTFDNFDQEGHALLSSTTASCDVADQHNGAPVEMMIPAVVSSKIVSEQSLGLLSDPVACGLAPDGLEGIVSMITVSFFCSFHFCFFSNLIQLGLKSQGTHFPKQFKYATDIVDDNEKVIVLFDLILDILDHHYAGLSKFPQLLGLYFILLNHVFEQKSLVLRDIKCPGVPQPDEENSDDEAETTSNSLSPEDMQVLFSSNLIVPANEAELCIRVHFLVKALFGPKLSFAEGQKRSVSAGLNSIGMKLNRDGFNSFSCCPTSWRIPLTNRPSKPSTGSREKVYISNLNENYFQFSKKKTKYHFYFCPEDGVVKKEKALHLKGKSLELQSQHQKTEQRIFLDVCKFLVESLLSRTDELCPYLKVDSSVANKDNSKKQKTDSVKEKPFDLWKCHFSHLIYKELKKKEHSMFATTALFLQIFEKYVDDEIVNQENSEKKKANAKRTPKKESKAGKKKDPSETTHVITRSKDIRNCFLKEDGDPVGDMVKDPNPTTGRPWLSIHSYPVEEIAEKRYFGANMKKSPDFYAFVGFNRFHSHFRESTVTSFPNESPKDWRVFLYYSMLTVHSKKTIGMFIRLLNNNGERALHNLPKQGFVHNPNEQNVDQSIYTASVSSGYV